MSSPCAICYEEPRFGLLFCKRCQRAFNQWNAKADCTHAALVEWVAKAARYWERKRGKAAPR